MTYKLPNVCYFGGVISQIITPIVSSQCIIYSGIGYELGVAGVVAQSR